MSPVLFYDPLCQQPYDTRTLHTQAMGGTESTLVRVADALGAWVMQHNRTHDWELCGPGARVYLWLHDRFHPRSRRARWLAATAQLLRENGVTAVCVSDWQRAGVEATLRSIGLAGAVRALTIYNPVEDALRPDGTAPDPDKLVFFSSPNKGLDFALDAFGELRRALPQLRLLSAIPATRRATARSAPASSSSARCRRRACTPRFAARCALSRRTSASRRLLAWCSPSRTRSARRC